MEKVTKRKFNADLNRLTSNAVYVVVNLECKIQGIFLNHADAVAKVKRLCLYYKEENQADTLVRNYRIDTVFGLDSKKPIFGKVCGNYCFNHDNNVFSYLSNEGPGIVFNLE